MFEVVGGGDQALGFSRLNTTGNVRGTNTCCILLIIAPRSSVTLKKYFNPVIVAFCVAADSCVDPLACKVPHTADVPGS